MNAKSFPVNICSTAQKLVLCTMVVFACGFTCASATAGQGSDATLYVCRDKGQIVLQNTQASATAHCSVKHIHHRTSFGSVPMTPNMPMMPYERGLDDPVATERTLIVGARIPSKVQQQRDAERTRILREELERAERSVIAMQLELQSSTHLSNASHANALVKSISLEQANIAALKRELAQSARE